jgi:hypothetical protein
VAQSAGDARKTTNQRPAEPAPGGEANQPGGGDAGHVCNVAFCPISLALTAAERAQPDVVAHLLVAGREFFLAAKAVMDARAEDLRENGSSDGPARMERIDVG